MKSDIVLDAFSKRFNENKEVSVAFEHDIVKLESELEVSIPEGYRYFLLNCGNLWTPSILDLIVDYEIELNDVQNFWSIDHILYDKKHEWSARLAVDFVPIASDSMGNLFGFLASDLRLDNVPSPVYFFDHDFDTIAPMANSFHNWIQKYSLIKSAP